MAALRHVGEHESIFYSSHGLEGVLKVTCCIWIVKHKLFLKEKYYET